MISLKIIDILATIILSIVFLDFIFVIGNMVYAIFKSNRRR